jgi:hypothetical protein
MTDSYGSVLRDRMKKSMEQPAKCHCLRCRGKVNMPKKASVVQPSWWELNNEWVGTVAWCFVAAMVGTGLIFVYGILPR